MSRRNIFAIVVIALSLLSNAYSQDTPDKAPDRGFQPGQSFSLSDIESVNLTNGNLMLDFPLGTLPRGRGSAGAGIALSYNSKIWDMRTEKTLDSSNNLVEQGFLNSSEEGGWRYGIDYRLEIVNRQLQSDDGYQCTTSGRQPDYRSVYQWKVKLHFPDGTIREFRPAGYSDTFPPQHGPQPDGYYNVHPDGTIRTVTFTSQQDPYTNETRWGCNFSTGYHPVTYMTYYSTDGSYLKLVYQRTGEWALYFPDGSRVEQDTGYGQQRVYDRNGNYVYTGTVTLPDGSTAAGWIDQFGRYTVKKHNTAANEDYIYRKGVGGELLKWTVKWKEVWVRKEYRTLGMSAGRERGGSSNQIALEMFEAVEKISLPEQLGNLAYSFSYYGEDTEPGEDEFSSGWGELKTVTLPSGANTLYTYNILLGENSLLEDEYDSLGAVFINPNHVIKRSVKTKTLSYRETYDGQSANRSETWNYRIGKTTSEVTGPDGSVETQLHGNTEYDNPYSGLVFKQTKPDGTTVEKFWMHNLPNAGLPASRAQELRFNQYVKAEIVTIPDAAGTPYLSAIREFSFDKNGNLTRTAEYDFVSPSSIQRDVTGRVTSIPTGMTPLRVTETAFHNPTEDASDNAANNPDAYWNTLSPNVRNAARTTALKSGTGSVVSFSEFFYDNFETTANVIETRAWDSHKGGTYQALTDPLTASNSVSTSVQYDAFGNPVLATDANGNQTQMIYGPVAGFAGLYPTEVRSAYGTAVQQTVQTEYDPSTGLPTRVTALGNTPAENVVGETEYDAVGRPVREKSAVGTSAESWQSTEYDDIELRIISRADVSSAGDGLDISISHFDQLGRIRLQRTIENPATETAVDETHGIKIQTRYRTVQGGDYTLTSNPFRAATTSTAVNEPTMGWEVEFESSDGDLSTTENFSGAGLPWPLGSNQASTGISKVEEAANHSTETDERGAKTRQVQNALGQLVRVDEPDTSGDLGTISNPSRPTSYLYDAAGNLTGIGQGSQTRSFAFSSLARLVSATNPESGTISYRYDSGGNLTEKTDARGISTIHTYDELNRAVFRNYSDSTPDINFSYDDPSVPFSKGKLTASASGESISSILAFDADGRVTHGRQRTDDLNYDFHYSFNAGGSLVSQTMPSGKIVAYDYDQAGRTARVSGTAGSNNRLYANGFSYAPTGTVERVRYGNAKWETSRFNSDLQITEIALGSSEGDSGLWRSNFEYGDWNSAGAVDQSKNNGNLAKQTVTVPAVGQNSGFIAEQQYAYDPLNRLISTVEIGGGNQKWKQSFVYDRYANRRIDAANSTVLSFESATAKVANPEILETNNRLKEDQDNDGLPDYQYDPAGNVVRDAQGREFQYDAENRQITATGPNLSQSYVYDPNGKRIKSVNHLTGSTTLFVYDSDGDLAAEYVSGAPAAQNPTISYLTHDALGSVRVVTDSDGEVRSRRDFLPFGEEIPAGVGDRTSAQRYFVPGDDIRKKFATYQRDSETNLDYAQSRYYSPMLGRFTSPDEFKGGPDELFDFEEHASGNPTFYADITNPQSLNKYQYSYNNPYRFTDPDGHCPPAWSCALYQARPIVDRLSISAEKVLQGAVTIVLTVAAASGDSTDGDASCRGCTSSQRMGQSLMSRPRGGNQAIRAASRQNDIQPVKKDPQWPRKRPSDNRSTNNPYSNQSNQSLLSSERSTKRQIGIHRKKLEDYRKNPDRFDNKKSLARAPNAAVRQKIIAGRIRKLETTIRKHENNLKKIEAEKSRRGLK